MPYELANVEGGWKVRKKGTSKFFSKKPKSKEAAKTQMAALYAAEDFVDQVELVIEQLLDVEEELAVRLPDEIAKKLHVSPGPYIFNMDQGGWVSPEYMVIERPELVAYLDQQLTDEQKAMVMKYGKQKEREKIRGRREEVPYEDLEQWEKEYLDIVKGFEKRAKANPDLKANDVELVDLFAKEFDNPADEYQVMDLGLDYVVVTSSVTRTPAGSPSGGIGTYIFRRSAHKDVAIDVVDDETGEVIAKRKVSEGEPYTSYIPKLRSNGKVSMRDNARRYDLGFFLRRDKRLHSINYVLDPGSGADYDEVRELALAIGESTEWLEALKLILG